MVAPVPVRAGFMRSANLRSAYRTIPWVLAGLLGGCGGGLSGADILDDLARRGLLPPEDAEPAFTDLATGTDPLARETLGLADLLEAADRHNPRIGEAKAAVGVAAGAAWQAGLPPNPSLELESEEIPLSAGGVGESTSTIGVVQPIIVSGRRVAAVAGGAATRRARLWELEQTRRVVFGALRRQVAEVLYLRRAIALNRELREVAGRTLRIAETRFDARAAPESEVIRARVEADRLELEITRLEHDLAAAGERLKTLVGGRDVPLDRLAVALDPTGPDLHLERLQHAVGERHPVVLAAGARIEAAEHRLAEARAGKHPDIAARLAYGFDGAGDEHIVEAGLVVPLTLFDRNQGNILRARYEVIAAKEQARIALHELRAELADAYERYMSARAQVPAFEQRIVAPAERSLAQTREGYTAGRLAFLDLLDAQRTLAGARVARLGVLRELNVARADLHRILGETLDPELPGELTP